MAMTGIGRANTISGAIALGAVSAEVGGSGFNPPCSRNQGHQLAPPRPLKKTLFPFAGDAAEGGASRGCAGDTGA